MKFTSFLILLFLLSPTVHAAVDPFKKMAKEIAKPLRRHDKLRIGLLAFPYHDGKISSGSSIVCERLTTHLVSAQHLRVVERRLVQKLLEEQKLSETGVIDPETARKMGQILGVDIIVTGTLIDLDNGQTEVNARALKSDTGEVVAASHNLIQRTWDDVPRLPQRNRAARHYEPEPEPDPTEPPVNEAIRIGFPSGRGSGGVYRK